MPLSIVCASPAPIVTQRTQNYIPDNSDRVLLRATRRNLKALLANVVALQTAVTAGMLALSTITSPTGANINTYVGTPLANLLTALNTYITAEREAERLVEDMNEGANCDACGQSNCSC